MRIATVHLLIDVETDAEACDFLSETLGGMPYLTDWAHAAVPQPPEENYTTEYVQVGEYGEGDFLPATR